MNEVSLKGFDWDSQKNASNAAKHGVSFEEAAELFQAPFFRVRSDRYGEPRWVALGKARNRVIAVIYTERNGRIRIISARRARKHEREIYEDRFGSKP